MSVFSSGLIFSARDTVRAKLIKTTETEGCELWVLEREGANETVGNTADWISNFKTEQQTFYEYFETVVDTIDPYKVADQKFTYTRVLLLYS